MSSESIQSEITAFLKDYFQAEVQNPDEDLTAIIPLDSLSIFEIIFFLEQKFKIKIPPGKIRLAGLNSVNKLAQLVQDAH